MSFNIFSTNASLSQDNESLQALSKLNPGHLEEWLGSGVHRDLIALNVKPITGEEAFQRIYSALDLSARRNDGRLREGWRRKHDELAATSGWWGSGIDPITWKPMTEWGRYKPTEGQIVDRQKGKPARYLSPYGVKSRLILLRVSKEIQQRVSKRYGIPVDVCDQDLDFWEWVWLRNVPLVITEGEKKAGSLLTQGYAAIALPGIWSGRRRPKDENGQFVGKPSLIPDLKVFDTPNRQVTFCYDYESQLKKALTVRSAAIRTGECFEDAEVKIAFLPGPQKGVDDFIVAGGDFDAVYQAARKLSAIKIQELWQLTFPVNLQLMRRYLGELPFPESGLVLIKSPKGTGKTTALQPLVSRATAAGRKVLGLNHRIALGQAICNAVGLPYISEVNETEQGRVAGFGLCIDSCHPQGQGRINPEDWAGAIVFIDECEQVIWHLLNSTTCREKRVLILKTFKELIRIVLSTGGLVIGLDADLSDLSVEFLRSCAGFDIQPWVCVNTWKPETGCDVYFLEPEAGKKDEPAALVARAVREVKEGGRIWLQTDSQKAKSSYGTKNLERYLRSKLGPNIKILRIDSETVSNPNHPAFGCAGNLNEVVSEYDVIIASPTLATGVSVDIKGHFTGVYAIFQGATPANEALQSLARVRELVPRYVWATKKAVGIIGNGSEFYKQLADSKHKDVKLNCWLLKEADFDIDKASDAITLRTWAKMGARINAAAWDFREAVREGLIAEGHTILPFTGTDRSTSDEIKAVKVQAWDEEAQAVAAAADISDQEHQLLQEKRSRTDEERITELKHQLRKRYDVEPIAELHKLDQSGWYGKIMLHYYASHDFEYVQQRDRKHLRSHIERGEGQVCTQDIHLSTARAQLFKALGILDLAMSGKQLTAKSPEIQALMDKLLKIQQPIKEILGVSVTPERVESQSMRIAQDLLGKAGLSLIRRQRRGDNGQQEYVFEGCQPKSKIERSVPHLRAEIFAAREKRDEQLQFKDEPCAVTDEAKPAVEELKPGFKAETVSQPYTELSSHTLIRKKINAVTPQEDQPETAPFKQGAVVRWAGKATQFAVSWCGIGIAAVRDVVSGQAFNAPTDELVLV